MTYLDSIADVYVIYEQRKKNKLGSTLIYLFLNVIREHPLAVTYDYGRKRTHRV